MKKCFTMIAIALYSLCIAGNNKNTAAMSDSVSVLNPKIVKALEACDSIQWMLLDPMASDSIGASFTLAGEVLSEASDTNGDRVGAVKATLLYPKSFEKKEMKKDCTFLPDVAFIAYNKGGKVIFAYSFYCDVCRFEFGSIKEEYDGELIRDAFLQLSLEVFPKDRYLRRIAGVTR